MVVNVGIETAGGSLPFVGAVFDTVFKANRRNYQLLKRHVAEPRSRRAPHQRLDVPIAHRPAASGQRGDPRIPGDRTGQAPVTRSLVRRDVNDHAASPDHQIRQRLLRRRRPCAAPPGRRSPPSGRNPASPKRNLPSEVRFTMSANLCRTAAPSISKSAGGRGAPLASSTNENCAGPSTGGAHACSPIHRPVVRKE